MLTKGYLLKQDFFDKNNSNLVQIVAFKTILRPGGNTTQGAEAGI
jgi:hypothetical protein